MSSCVASAGCGSSREGEDGETRLYCESEWRKQKENAIVERARERLEKELGKLHEGLSKPRSTKRLEKVWQRLPCWGARQSLPMTAPGAELGYTSGQSRFAS